MRLSSDETQMLSFYLNSNIKYRGGKEKEVHQPPLQIPNPFR